MGDAVNELDRQPDSKRIQAIVFEVARRLHSGGDALVEQARVATASRATPAWVDFQVPEGVRKGEWADGPLPLSPVVLSPDGDPYGTIHVWVARGTLSAIEQGWFEGVPPVDWPTPERLRWSS